MTGKYLLGFAVLMQLAISFQAFAQKNKNTAATEKKSISDGPYVTISSSSLGLNWVCNDTLKYKEIDLPKLPYQFDKCGLTANIHHPDNITQSKAVFSGEFPIVALSDIHGQFDLMKTLLRNNGIIDNEYHWAFGNGHLVITGDIFDRGDFVTETLWFLYQLEQQAKKLGGRVHLLLGNHEVMILENDQRYLSKKYQKVTQIFNQDINQLFGSNTLLGKWLRSKPTILKLNNILFMHGGLHPMYAEKGYSVENINNLVLSAIKQKDLNHPLTEAQHNIIRVNGPLWFRGYFDALDQVDVDKLLAHYDVDHIIVGHTSYDTIQLRAHGKIIGIDTSIKKGKSGEILKIENNHFYRGNLNGTSSLLLAP